MSVPASQPSTELPLVKAEEEDADTMDDVAALAGHGKSQDALATLESALRPVERYAVHFLEEVWPMLPWHLCSVRLSTHERHHAACTAAVASGKH